MTYAELRDNVSGMPLFSWQALKMYAGGRQELKNQLTRWKQSGKLLSLRKGFYILNEQDRKLTPSRMFIASELYKPSYVSLEFALSYYGIIPEKVSTLTCITTKKTEAFENKFGIFSYRHIKPSCFTGFTAKKDEAGLTYLFAEPEKAVADFIYLNLGKFKEGGAETLRDSYRFKFPFKLNRSKLTLYGELFRNTALQGIIKEVK